MGYLAPDVFADEGPHLGALHVVPVAGARVHLSTQTRCAVRFPFVPVGIVEVEAVGPSLS